MTRQGIDSLHGILTIGVGVGVQRQRGAERDEHPRAERLAGLEREPHGQHRQRARMSRLPRQRDARGARLDLLHTRFGVGRALGVDCDERAALEGRRAGGERVGVPVCCRGIRVIGSLRGWRVLLSPHGDGAGGEQKA